MYRAQRKCLFNLCSLKWLLNKHFRFEKKIPERKCRLICMINIIDNNIDINIDIYIKLFLQERLIMLG